MKRPGASSCRAKISYCNRIKIPVETRFDSVHFFSRISNRVENDSKRAQNRQSRENNVVASINRSRSDFFDRREEMVNASSEYGIKIGPAARHEPVKAKENGGGSVEIGDAISKIHSVQQSGGGEAQYLVTLVGGHKVVRVSSPLAFLLVFNNNPECIFCIFCATR